MAAIFRRERQPPVRGLVTDQARYDCPNHHTAHAVLACRRCRAIVEAHRARRRALDLANEMHTQKGAQT
jgi:hypothetical protein